MVELILGIILGLLWTWFNVWLFFKIAKINCPKCQQLKPLKETFVFSWKEFIIRDKPCLKCQQPQPQIEIF